VTAITGAEADLDLDPGPVAKLTRSERFAFDFFAVLGGTAAALLLLWYLHGAWQPGRALGCGLISGIVLRRMARPSYKSFPSYLRRPIDTGVVLFGAITTSWATLAREPTSVWLLRWREAVTLPLLAVVLGLGLVGVVYSHARMRREIEEARAREAALRESALRARLRALQAQINPHFLFNAFNALAELTHAEPEVAEQMVGDLAHILRYTLRSSAEGVVHVSRELEVIRRYLRVEEARLGKERLHVIEDIAPDTLSVQIPGLVLQPLVENAVLHAVAPRKGGGTIRIAIEAQEDHLLIRVDDNGPGLPPEIQQALAIGYEDAIAAESSSRGGTGGAGGGLVNVQQRLLLRYRGAATLETSQLDPGTRIEVRIPK
jgi:signal transduction histidine kinase